MEKPNFKDLGFTRETTPINILEKIKAFTDFILENKDEMTVGEMRRAMKGIILCAGAILSPLDGDMPMSMVLGMLAGECAEGEIMLEFANVIERAEQARLN